MRVLVTGGGGFLGSAICRQLSEHGHRVHAFQRSPAEHLSKLGVRSFPGDINDGEALAAAARGCDAVIHSAAKAGVWGEAAEYERINVTGTAAVIRACHEQEVPFLVFTSSPSVVHSGGDLEGVDETVPLAVRFKAAYPATKARAEAMVLAANERGLSTMALRPHLIWGPGDPHILPRLKSNVRRGKLFLPGPEKVIDTIFVDNAALAHRMALEGLISGRPCAGKPYFVTNNQPLPQREIVAGLLRAAGTPVEIRPVPVPVALFAAALCEMCWRLLRLGSEPPLTRFAIEQLATAHWFDTGAAARDFGYRAKITIEEGLAALAAS